MCVRHLCLIGKHIFACQHYISNIGFISHFGVNHGIIEIGGVCSICVELETYMRGELCFMRSSYTQGELSMSLVHQDRGSIVLHCLSYAYFEIGGVSLFVLCLTCVNLVA